MHTAENARTPLEESQLYEDFCTRACVDLRTRRAERNKACIPHGHARADRGCTYQEASSVHAWPTRCRPSNLHHLLRSISLDQ